MFHIIFSFGILKILNKSIRYFKNIKIILIAVKIYTIKSKIDLQILKNCHENIVIINIFVGKEYQYNIMDRLCGKSPKQCIRKEINENESDPLCPRARAPPTFSWL